MLEELDAVYRCHEAIARVDETPSWVKMRRTRARLAADEVQAARKPDLRWRRKVVAERIICDLNACAGILLQRSKAPAGVWAELFATSFLGCWEATDGQHSLQLSRHPQGL